MYANLPAPLNAQNTHWPFTQTANSMPNNNIAWPKITIITPSYNQAEFIEQTIRSVLMQNYPNLQYIIIDGGSTDNTVNIIKHYEDFIDYWISEPDRGQSHAINKGLEKATGDIVNWLNSDDYFAPNALFRIGEVMANASVNCYSGRTNQFDNATNKTLFISNGLIVRHTVSASIGMAIIDQPATFFRLSFFKTQFPPVNEHLHYIMDKELAVRYFNLYGHTGIVKDDFVLVNFRHHQSSKTVSLHYKFSAETAELMAGLARLLNLNAMANTIEQCFGLQQGRYVPQFTPKHLTPEALWWYLATEAHQQFADKKPKNAIALAKHIPFNKIVIGNPLLLKAKVLNSALMVWLRTWAKKLRANWYLFRK